MGGRGRQPNLRTSQQSFANESFFYGTKVQKWSYAEGQHRLWGEEYRKIQRSVPCQEGAGGSEEEMLRALQRRHKGLGTSVGPEVGIEMDSVCAMTRACGGHKGPECDSGKIYAIRVSDYSSTTFTKNPSLSIRKPDELQICVCLSGACCCHASLSSVGIHLGSLLLCLQHK